MLTITWAAVPCQKSQFVIQDFGAMPAQSDQYELSDSSDKSNLPDSSDPSLSSDPFDPSEPSDLCGPSDLSDPSYTSNSSNPFDQSYPPAPYLHMYHGSILFFQGVPSSSPCCFRDVFTHIH